MAQDSRTARELARKMLVLAAFSSAAGHRRAPIHLVQSAYRILCASAKVQQPRLS